MRNGPRKFKQLHFAMCSECGELLVRPETMYRTEYLCADCGGSKKEEVGLNG